jgi:hypothetical protein
MISRGGTWEELLRSMRCFEIPLYSSLSREATDVHERPNTTVDTEDDLIVQEGLLAVGNLLDPSGATITSGSRRSMLGPQLSLG